MADGRSAWVGMKVGIQIAITVRYWFPVVAVMTAIAYCSSLSSDQLPHFTVFMKDKVEHLVAYALLGFCIARALTYHHRENPEDICWQRIVLITTLCAALYGALDEWHQSFTPGRSVEWADGLADTIGGFLGASLTRRYRFWLARSPREKAQ